ncbi:MAG: DNA primase catalytic subunit PriS [Thermoplasmata archaeon]|nr:MAG: DNA primase catalytic subunit PriS [Thermoplasmata archaeon]
MDKNTRIQQSLGFLQHHFNQYYKTHQLPLPDRFSRREFAFMFFGGKGMLRHLSFTKKQQYQIFLQQKAPAHCYYSTAYYKTPDAQTMNDKEWMGAELIFDLDADHLPNAETIPYETQLEMVKEEFIKLVDDFLLQDFGFHKKDLELYFSGGRGYHCHVKDPKIMQLDSGSRREIVDYIIGRDLIDELVFHEYTTGLKKYKNISYPTGKSLKMPSPNEPGWRGRISRGLIEILEEITKSDHPIDKLKTYGVDEITAKKLLKELSKERIDRIKKGQLDQTKTIRKFFLNNALRKTAVSFASGETDEPVTCDVKRLIRLPGSLHGKTGFFVKKVTLDQLQDFDPLIETIAFSDEPVEIDLLSKTKMTINDSFFDLSEGKQKVPLFLAIFLIGRKQAFIC